MLTGADIQQLEATLLPARDRHYLRLLAHALRTLQAIVDEANLDPNQPLAADVIHHWVIHQAAAAHDAAFAHAFSTQLGRAAQQLQAIAAPLGVAPLALTLHDLVAWAEAKTDGVAPTGLRSSLQSLPIRE